MSELTYWRMVRYFGGYRHHGYARFKTVAACRNFTNWLEWQNGK